MYFLSPFPGPSTPQDREDRSGDPVPVPVPVCSSQSRASAPRGQLPGPPQPRSRSALLCTGSVWGQRRRRKRSPGISVTKAGAGILALFSNCTDSCVTCFLAASGFLLDDPHHSPGQRLRALVCTSAGRSRSVGPGPAPVAPPAVPLVFEELEGARLPPQGHCPLTSLFDALETRKWRVWMSAAISVAQVMALRMSRSPLGSFGLPLVCRPCLPVGDAEILPGGLV